MVWPCHQNASEKVSRTVFASKDKSKEACVIDLNQDDKNEEDLTRITKARTRSQEKVEDRGCYGFILSCKPQL